jgi:uncharacterized protein YjdB
MANFKIFYRASDTKAVVQLAADAAPDGFTEIGTFTDPDAGTLGTDNKVAFNYVKNALYAHNGVGGITDMSRVSIHIAPQVIDVLPATATIAAAETVQLTSKVTTPNHSHGADSVTWASDTPGVATVDAAGLVTGVATGSATITATTDFGAKTDTAVITVS